jgi:hypothetical protein
MRKKVSSLGTGSTAPTTKDLPVRKVQWQKAYRLIASRYPPIALFERLTPDPAVWDALILLEQVVNPRVRDQVGEIALVPPEERVSGPGASWVMAAFTHVNPLGSRFSDGSFGVYYAAKELLTAIKEVSYHFERFARAAADPIREEDMRVLAGPIRGSLLDVAGLRPKLRRELLHGTSYAESQRYAASVRRQVPGILYPSVRHPDGACVAMFRPNAVALPKPERHVRLHYNGTRVDRYFDYRSEQWYSLVSR